MISCQGVAKTYIVRERAGLFRRVTRRQMDVLHEPAKVRRKLGVVLAGERTLYWKLTAMENFLLFGGLQDLPREARARAEELLELVGLSDFSDVSVEKFSSGMRKRLAVARALVHRLRPGRLGPSAACPAADARRGDHGGVLTCGRRSRARWKE